MGGWLLATAAATAIGILAVTAIGSGIAGTGTQPLSAEQVERQLSAGPESPDVAPTSPTTAAPTRTPSTATASTGSPSPGRSPSVGPSIGAEKVIGSVGGSVVARCVDDRAELLSWSPAQGYQVDDLHRGPATTAGIQFESDDLEVNVLVTCAGGVPTGHISTQRD